MLRGLPFALVAATTLIAAPARESDELIVERFRSRPDGNTLWLVQPTRLRPELR